jgi:hypothetical protein
LEVKTSSFYWTQQSGDVVLLFPRGRWREFLAWDGQIGPVILGGSIDYRLVDPAVCHEQCVNVNNLENDPLSTSEP